MTTENRTYLWKSGGGLPYLPGVGMVIIDSAVRSRFAPLGSMRASPRLSEWGHHHEHVVMVSGQFSFRVAETAIQSP